MLTFICNLRSFPGVRSGGKDRSVFYRNVAVRQHFLNQIRWEKQR